MTGRLIRVVVVLCLVGSLAVDAPTFAQGPAPRKSSPQTPAAATPNAAMPYTSFLLRRDYSKGKRTLPNIFAAYTGQNISQPNLMNSPNVYSLIRDGKLNLSLQDAIALALENDLNIGVAEYTPWIDETNILNAEGGGAPLGQFVIGGGGGGSFDPVIAVNSSISDISQSVNNPLSSGVGTNSGAITQTSHNAQVNLSYTQEFHSGTVFNVQLNNNRNSSSPSANFFNPALTSALVAQIQQPLLNGWGFLPHTRFILEAKDNTKIGQFQFEETVITEITQVQAQYWNLVFDRQAVETAKQTLAGYQRLYDDDERRLKIGTASPSDVVFAEASIAQGNQILIGAQVNESVQEDVLRNLITKDPSDSRLKGVEIVPTTPLEVTPQVPDVTLEDAVKEAFANRPELQVDQLTLRNDRYDVRATRNSLLPTLTLSGEYVSVGLSGNTAGAFVPNGTFSPALTEPVVDQNGNPVTSNGIPIFIGVANGAIGATIPGGIGSAYSQIFHNRSPEYAASLNLNLPLRNRSAQAANAQDQLIERRDKLSDQRQRSTIFSNVSEALTAVKLDAAQVQEATKATQLAQQSYDYEVKKFNFGNSDTFKIVQYVLALNGAKLSELQVKAGYEIALANFNQVLGRTLKANNITIADHRNGSIELNTGTPLIPGTLDGRLAGAETSDSGAHK
jgi:outer membrane protein TolC